MKINYKALIAIAGVALVWKVMQPIETDCNEVARRLVILHGAEWERDRAVESCKIGVKMADDKVTPSRARFQIIDDITRVRSIKRIGADLNLDETIYSEAVSMGYNRRSRGEYSTHL